jgi:hypothetical protein
MRSENILAALLLLVAPAVSFAGVDGTALPEPESLALFAGAGVAWAIVHWIKRK